MKSNQNFNLNLKQTTDSLGSVHELSEKNSVDKQNSSDRIGVYNS